MTEPKVSVIIPCYNAERTIERALSSAASQTHGNVEIVVADDGSTDGTRDRVRAHEAFRRGAIHMIELPHGGANAARNRGFARATGDFIQWLDADDALEPDKIARHIALALRDPGAVVYGPWILFWRERNRERRSAPQGVEPAADPLAAQLAGFLAPPHAFLFPRDVLLQVGPWDESLVADMDGDLLFRLLLKGNPFCHCPDGLAHWHHETRASRVSLNVSPAAFQSRLLVCRRVARGLRERDLLSRYAAILAGRIDVLAQMACLDYPEFAAECRSLLADVAPGYRPAGTRSYRLARACLGLRGSERLRRFRRRLLRFVRSGRPDAPDWIADACR